MRRENNPTVWRRVLIAALPFSLLFVTIGYSQPGGFRLSRLRLAPQPAVAAAARTTDADEDPSEERFPGGAALKTDPEQQRLLKRAEQCVADGRLDLAVVLWQKVLDEAGDTLTTHDGRTYVSLADEVEQTLASLDADALKTYRLTADGEAQTLLSLAKSPDDEDALARVVRRYFLSSIGDDAAYKLGCAALDRYDFVGAARLFQKILDRHPDPSIPRGEIWMRLAVASARVADRETSQAALTAIEKEPLDQRPSRATLAQVKQSIETATALASVQPGETHGWHMAMGTASRNGHMPSLPTEVTSRTLTELWSKESGLVDSEPTSVAVYGGFAGGMLGFSGRMPGAVQPQMRISRTQIVSQWRQNGWRPTPELLFDEGRVYVKTPEMLVAYDTSATSEKRLWQSAWSNQYQLDGMSQMLAMLAANMGMAGGQTTKPRSIAEVLLFGDRVHQSMSIAGGMIYSIEGKRLVKDGSAQTTTQPRGHQWGVTPRRTRTNWLAAYEAKSGKAKWHRGASDEDKEASQDVGFLAAPVPFGDLLLAPVTDGGTIWLYALSNADGATVWKSYLCDEPTGGCSPWSPVYVAVDGRDAYVTCGAGVVFAVDAVSGAIRWAVRYERSGQPDMRMQNHGYGASALLTLNGWEEDVVIPHGRTLVVLASDCDKLFALDRRSGKFLWDSPRRDADYCLGVNGRGLFVAGRNVARRYDIPTGLLVWDEEIGDSFGRGAVTGDAVYLPIKDSILKLDLAKGKELAHVGVSLTVDDPVGNLYSDGEKLWVAGAGRVYAMTNLEHRLSILQQQIAAGDTEAQLNRARLYAKQKQYDAVFNDLRGAFARVSEQQSLAANAALQVLAVANELKLPQQQPLATLQMTGELLGSIPSGTLQAKDARLRRADTIANALRAVRQKKSPGSVAAVLSVAPLLDQDHLLTLASQTLDEVATPSDQRLLLAAVRGKPPAGQMIAVGALAKLSPDLARKEYGKLAKSDDERVRLAAARGLLNQGERAALSNLVVLLESDNARIRARSHHLLRAASGQSIAFPANKPEEKAKSIAAWKEWIAGEGKTAKLRLPLPADETQLGRTLYVSHVHSLVRELDSEHNERWSVKLANPWGCLGLPNGHRLIASHGQNLVVEYDDEGNEVQKNRLPSPPYSVQRLENGNTLVVCADVQQLVEIAPDGKTTTQTVQGRPMCARRLESGNTLVALQQNNRVVELDPDQKVVWEARNLNGPCFVERLENGNTLIVQMYNGQVVEIDASGQNVVWQTRLPLVNPCSAQRLPNGNTLVADNNAVREIDPSGQKVVWELRQNNVTCVSQY